MSASLACVRHTLITGATQRFHCRHLACALAQLPECPHSAALFVYSPGKYLFSLSHDRHCAVFPRHGRTVSQVCVYTHTFHKDVDAFPLHRGNVAPYPVTASRVLLASGIWPTAASATCGSRARCQPAARAHACVWCVPVCGPA